MRITTFKCVRPCTSPNPTPGHHHHREQIGGATSTTYKPAKCKKTPAPTAVKVQAPVTNRKMIKNSMKFGENWTDYQGGKNWEGLLDPLDENLRSEIIRYGHFVEAAYRSCDFDQSSPSYATCRYTKRKLLKETGFSDTGYRVTKYLTATSGIQLPGWAERGPPWMAVQSSWIGYVAVCHDREEISRLGRRDVVIALRGTATGLEWLENLRATLTPLSGSDSDSDSGSGSGSDTEPMVESGFLSLYTSSMGNRRSLQSMVREEIGRVLEKYGDEPLSFTFTGHSLGAALATLAAYDIKRSFGNSPLVTVISFAGPRVGNWRFRCGLEDQGTKVLRIVNSDDVVTKVPGFVIDNNEGGGGTVAAAQQQQSRERSGGSYTAAAAASFTGWVQKLVEDTQWVYADVGCELRLSSRDSPDLNGISIATCHELKTYLHLVNGFVGSNCPFKATARKMLCTK